MHFIATRLCDSFGVSEETAVDFVHRHVSTFADLFACLGPAHLIVLFQTKERRTEVRTERSPASQSALCPRPHSLPLKRVCCLPQEGEWLPGVGEPRLHLTYGDDEPLRCKALYVVRNSMAPIDVDKAGDNAIIVGEVARDALRHLEVQLHDAFSKHVDERTEWGEAPTSAGVDLSGEMRRTVSVVGETLKGLSVGLELSSLDVSIDLDALLRGSIVKAKSKKPPLEAEHKSSLHGACRARARRVGDAASHGKARSESRQGTPTSDLRRNPPVVDPRGGAVPARRADDGGGARGGAPRHRRGVASAAAASHLRDGAAKTTRCAKRRHAAVGGEQGSGGEGAAVAHARPPPLEGAGQRRHRGVQ